MRTVRHAQIGPVARKVVYSYILLGVVWWAGIVSRCSK